MNKNIRNVFLVLFAAVLVLGCVQQSQTQQPQAQPNETHAPQTRQFSMVISHTFYNPSVLTVNKGDTVVIKAVAAPGTASHLHGITIDEFDVNEAVTSEDPNNPVVIQFVADKEGTFTIYCQTCWSGPFGQGHPPIKAFLEVKP
ncbi:MAG: cupredoxin domain-containing protein [Candidatus Aenigmarchaeota archaeon]|nr:cupredoxin domain-containing protein [Candidatus Aenigmarchaeota archaeon]